MEASRIAHAFDLQQARSVSAGSVEAWHDIVQRYSGLVLTVVRRYLADFEEEAQRDTYVEVLEYLYETGLAKYDGRASLSTWVMAIARSRALDRRRARLGRKRDPAWMDALQALDREIFHLYYEEGASIGSIRERLADRGEAMTVADVSRALDRIEEQMDPRVRSRLAYDLYARSIGAASGNLLDLLDHLKRESAAAAEALRPDLILLEQQANRLLEQVQRALLELDAEERKVVELRFYQSLTARQIATEMGLQGPRRAYSLIDRALDHLRQLAQRTLPPTAALEERAPKPESTDA